VTSAAAKAARREAPESPAANVHAGAPKIAHLTSVHPPFDVRIFHKECKSLARASYDVTLIACHDRDETVEGVRLRAVPRLEGRLSRMVRTTIAILRQALREDADLYHFHDPELIPVALILRLQSKKVVYDAHENVPADISAKHYIPRLFRSAIASLAGFLEMRSCCHFSAIIPATAGIQHRFERYTTNTVLIRNYPSADELSSDSRPWSQRSNSVVYAGLLSPDRCIKEILQALELLPSTLKARANLAGPFSPPAYAREIAATEGRHCATFLGVIDHTEVTRLFEDGRVGLCLCRPTPGYLESAPTKIFEYMQAGMPVVASDFPAFRAIVAAARCGLLVDPLNPQAIAHAIEYLLTHPMEAEQMGRRGREAASRTFNWTSEEEKLLALYARLLNPQPSTAPSRRERGVE